MKKLKEHILIFVGLAAYLCITRGTGIGCPIRFVTHVPCPGCGLSRAWASFVQLKLGQAFHYHPLFLLAPVLLFVAVHEGLLEKKGISPKLSNGFLYVCSVLFIALYILRVFVWKVNYI